MKFNFRRYFPQKWFPIFSGVSLLGLLGIVIARLRYLIQFGSGPQTKEEWGTYGDYFGGVLNPIFAFFSLMVLIYISFQIADQEQHRSERDLANQKEFALYSLRHDALKSLVKIFHKMEELLSPSDPDMERYFMKLFSLQVQFKSFIEIHTYLFVVLKNFDPIPLADVMVRLGKVNFNLQNQLGKPISNKSDEIYSARAAEVEEYLRLKTELVNLMIEHMELTVSPNR